MRFRCGYFSVSSHEKNIQNVNYGMVYCIYIYLHTTSICNENILIVLIHNELAKSVLVDVILISPIFVYWFKILSWVVHNMSKYTLRYLVSP